MPASSEEAWSTSWGVSQARSSAEYSRASLRVSSTSRIVGALGRERVIPSSLTQAPTPGRGMNHVTRGPGRAASAFAGRRQFQHVPVGAAAAVLEQPERAVRTLLHL